MLQRRFLLALGLPGLFLVIAILGAFGLFGLADFPRLADAMADIADGIEPAHILLLEEINGIAFAFRKQGNEDVGARDFITARGLDVQDGALHHPLKPAGGGGIRFAFQPQRFQLCIQIMGDGIAQFARIDAARDHDL